MSSVQYLREFVTERLTAAAQEILGVLEKTIVQYEEEIDRQRRLLDIVLKPEIKLHTIELPKQHVCKEGEVLTDQQLCNQERRSSVDQVDPEPSQIIEEGEELCSSQRGEDLLLKQETDTFMLIPTNEESDHQVLSDSFPITNSQDTERRKHVDSGSTKKAEPEPKKICHIITSDNNNTDNTFMSGTHCDSQTELPRQHVCKEEEVLTDQQLQNQERNSNLDQEDPETSEIKEEQEELCISQRVEELVPKNETENFMLIPPYEESDHQLLSESQQVDLESTRTLELKPNREHINTSYNKNVDNSLMSETHCDTHTGKRSFTCGTCGKMFKYKSAFDIHLRIHTGEKPYVCNTCGKRFTRVSALNVHLRIHTGERPYFCRICRNTFTFRSGLLAHIRTHSCEKTYSCLGCGKAFKDSHDLKIHMQTHTGKSPYTCNKCGKRFSDTSSVRQHIKTHKGEKPYPCHICSTRFIYGHDLKIHMKTHTGEKPYSCKTCGKRFSATKLLKSHMKVHTAVNAYVCETCGKCFTFSSNLWVHLRTHTGEKPYSCKTCGKGFLCSRDLKGHMRTHTGEKPYACNTCGTRFGCSASLKRHSRIHTGERPYSCDICGRSFTHNSSFLAHRRTHTGESRTPGTPVGKDTFRCRTSEDT